MSPSWRPARLASGLTAAFHGYFDNQQEIADLLEVGGHDPNLIYGLAVERWGDEADRLIIGEYAAIVVHPDRTVRLSRAALRGPPLYYHANSRFAAAASVPRALFAAGVERRLNEERVADSALLNFTDPEQSWYQDVHRVPVGHIVELAPGRSRSLRKYYDLFAAPDIEPASDAECLAKVSDLLDRGVRACLRGFSQPGATLSSGLDSPQVAVRALKALPNGDRLPTFTFHPESGYDGLTDEGGLGDERPLVEAFVELHPRLEPHFTSNPNTEHDYRWNELFHLMGGAPSGLCNMYVFHGLLEAASKRRCDVLLIAEWGNFTFSDKGSWGYLEYFLNGNWRQLWLAYKHQPHDNRPLPLRFFIRTLAAFIPVKLWRILRRLGGSTREPLIEILQPLTKEFRSSSGADDRLKQSGLELERFYPRNRRDAMRDLFKTDDCETAEVYQGFEQLYGIAIRDPTSYRPLVEYCLGLPVQMFMRDGQLRWLAKELAKGIMLEEQRANRRNGRWDADWHLRIGRRRQEYLAELEALKKDEQIARVVDIGRIQNALEDWPERTDTRLSETLRRQFAIPRALLTARFIKYVEGRNQG